MNKKIIIFSGAGLSAESGISTFRDSNGLWENHSIEEVCNENTWRDNFDLVHKFYNERRKQLKDVEPNEAHKTIKRLYDRFGDDLIVVTQNVDNLLERAGIPENKIIHLHGRLEYMECAKCNGNWKVGYREYTYNDFCPYCGSEKDIRPNIVFFNGPAYEYLNFYNILNEFRKNPGYFVVIGTMGNIVPIDDLLLNIPKKSKILNNLEPSKFIPFKRYGQVYYEKATTALPKIEEFLTENFKRD